MKYISLQMKYLKYFLLFERFEIFISNEEYCLWNEEETTREVDG